jgi:hypothetical protein
MKHAEHRKILEANIRTGFTAEFPGCHVQVVNSDEDETIFAIVTGPHLEAAGVTARLYYFIPGQDERFYFFAADEQSPFAQLDFGFTPEFKAAEEAYSINPED